VRNAPTDVAANLRAEIARQRKRQTDLAAALGISAPALSRRLKGETPISVDELQVLADRLDRPMSFFLGEKPAA
jgi:transcriptional regulator with XRE-family HTH domain